jgi:hypothetical protein
MVNLDKKRDRTTPQAKGLAFGFLIPRKFRSQDAGAAKRPADPLLRNKEKEVEGSLATALSA